ncbi:unannotated protein [freshwater metagenome]|uniref:Unannotated protein n=1 Tax=freshwater metagenome TaxID=449393 RepID=A0A6J7K538_9ZZZZ
MSGSIDRRRFLLRSLTGVAGAAVAVVAGPEFIGTAGATPPASTPLAKGPNLVFDWDFELDTVGASPRGWILS